MKWWLLAAFVCLNVQASESKTPDPSARRAAAVRNLTDNHYGGSYYRDKNEDYRKEKDQWAMGVLTAAGFTADEARAEMARIRTAEAAKPKPKLSPAFTQPEGKLRGSPSIDFKKKGAVKK